MTNRQEDEQMEYGIDRKELEQRALTILQGNSEYRKLDKEFQKLDTHRDLVKINYIKTKMRAMVGQKIDALWAMEIKRRKDVNHLNELLKSKDINEYHLWQDLLSALTFAMDIIDFSVHDIDELLQRNNIGIRMTQYEEITAARAIAQQLTGDSLGHSEQWHTDLWMEESDRIWEYVKERSSVYRRKADRIEERKEKRKAI